MKDVNDRKGLRSSGTGLPAVSYGMRGLILLAVMLAVGRVGGAQSSESANAGNRFLWVGGAASGSYIQYGAQKNLGVTGYFDADSIRRLGFEGEGRWMEFHQAHNIHAETYLAGPRFHFNVGRFQPYVKGLTGLGNFNFSYNYAKGRYFVIGSGGGFDYRLNSRLSTRADFEYQYWPKFTFGPMSSGGVSIGIRYLIVR